MKKNSLILIVLIALTTFSACKKGGGGAPEPEPSITPVGTNDGTATTKTIGSAGGSVMSADGKVELIIPSGALATNTDITIQPITNNIPTGRGKAYRFTPDGQQFAKDITLKFHYTEEDAVGTKPEYMQVAFQNADGTWKVVDKVTNDEAANTINASVNHFTDFSQFDIIRLIPASLFVKTGATGQFEISYAGMTTQNIISFGTQLLQTPAVWKANGVTGGNSTNGTIQSTAPVKANYTAPANTPLINPIQISAEINIPFTIDGQRFNKGIVTGNAFITGNNYHVTIENELTIQIGTLEKFVMKDKVTFDIHLVGGVQGMVDNLQNSTPTVEKIAESPAGCQTTFTRLGTGTMHFNADHIDVMVDPTSKTVFVGSDAISSNDVLPMIHTACPGVTPADNELPIAGMFGLFNIEFQDSGQQQIIDKSQPGNKMKYTITPVN